MNDALVFIKRHELTMTCMKFSFENIQYTIHTMIVCKRYNRIIICLMNKQKIYILQLNLDKTLLVVTKQDCDVPLYSRLDLIDTLTTPGYVLLQSFNLGR